MVKPKGSFLFASVMAYFFTMIFGGVIYETAQNDVSGFSEYGNVGIH